MNSDDEVRNKSVNAPTYRLRSAKEEMPTITLMAGTPRVSLTMPLRWMARGYVQAVRRYETAAATPSATAREVCIALFELSNWIDSIADRAGLSGDAHVQGFRFVRHRTHHHFAAAVILDQDFKDWLWGPVENMPLPENSRHRNERLQPAYEQLLAGRPVLDVLRHIEKLVVATRSGA